MEVVEKAGEIFGKFIVFPWIKFLQKKVGKFDIQYSGIQFLKDLEGRSYILVANHLKPDGIRSQEMGLSQDVFVLSRIVFEHTGKQLRIVSKSDNGWWSDKSFLRLWQRKCQPFGDGMSKGMGMIPVRKNPGSLNSYFLKLIEIAVQKKQPILMFPEGNWYQDFNPENKLESGVAHLALKYNLPIIPAYIHGCHSWKQSGKIRLSFGERFYPTGKTKDKIVAEISERITNLQNQIIK